MRTQPGIHLRQSLATDFIAERHDGARTVQAFTPGIAHLLGYKFFQARQHGDIDGIARDALRHPHACERLQPRAYRRILGCNEVERRHRMRLGSAEACPVVSYNARMPTLGLIDQQELLRWANTVSARSDFPRLVRRLILETGTGVVQLGFPAGEGVSVGSWDGTVRSTEATAFIPLGPVSLGIVGREERGPQSRH